MLSIAGYTAAHCRGLGGTPAKRHFTLDLSFFAPSLGDCHQASATSMVQPDVPSAWPGHLETPRHPYITQVFATQHLPAFLIKEAVQVTQDFNLPGLHRRRRGQTHYYQPAERTQYEPLKSR